MACLGTMNLSFLPCGFIIYSEVRFYYSSSFGSTEDERIAQVSEMWPSQITLGDKFLGTRYLDIVLVFSTRDSLSYV